MNEVARNMLDELIAKWSDGIIRINELFQKVAKYRLSLSMLDLGTLNKIAEALIAMYKAKPQSSRDINELADDREKGVLT